MKNKFLKAALALGLFFGLPALASCACPCTGDASPCTCPQGCQCGSNK